MTRPRPDSAEPTPAAEVPVRARRRTRITVRWLMLLVAVAALAAGLVARRDRLRRLADRHAARADEREWFEVGGRSGGNPLLVLRSTPLGRWHRAMAGKYRRASSRPWRPVAPDPPPWSTEAEVEPDPPDPDLPPIRRPHP